MNRLTTSITIISILGIIAAGIFAYPWNPPLPPNFMQACGCVAALCQAINLFLGGRPVSADTLAKARTKLSYR